MKTFSYGQDRMTVDTALAIARGETKGVISPEVYQQIEASRQAVVDIVKGEKQVYGINTGFGPLCTTTISSKDAQKLQYNILKSHSVGVGEAVDIETSKLMLIIKAHALAFGYSGISHITLSRIIWHINEDIIPVVPSQGSVGASGDLAPLAHLFLPLIGLGKVHTPQGEMDTSEWMGRAHVGPIQLKAKEGLALINGTQFIAANAIQLVEKMENCLDHADIIGAMMIDGLLGSSRPFRQELHQLRPFEGNKQVAARVGRLLGNSEIGNSHLNCNRVQDPYSLRCIPQVHGASRTAWMHLKELVEIELNAVTDNPVIISNENVISGGNFHGQPLALPIDYACLAASELGNISDRRIYLSLEGTTEGLPKLLMKETGLNSGFMLLQYTSAALASENKSLCYPASADSIPTSLGQEDHVSMGSIGVRKALRVVQNLEKILAIELLCAAQALDFRKPLKPGPTLQACHEQIRKTITHATEDRIFSEDIDKALTLIQNQELVKILKKYEASHFSSHEQV